MMFLFILKHTHWGEEVRRGYVLAAWRGTGNQVAGTVMEGGIQSNCRERN